jgi:hypothetical protein
MNAVINQPHAPVAELNKDMPPGLCGSIDKALAKQPADRYQTVETMRGDLSAVAQTAGLPNYHASDQLTGSVPINSTIPTLAEA